MWTNTCKCDQICIPERKALMTFLHHCCKISPRKDDINWISNWYQARALADVVVCNLWNKRCDVVPSASVRMEQADTVPWCKRLACQLLCQFYSLYVRKSKPIIIFIMSYASLVRTYIEHHWCIHMRSKWRGRVDVGHDVAVNVFAKLASQTAAA